MTPKTRVCYSCATRKRIQSFKRDSRKPGRRGYLCKSCAAVRSSVWRRENKEHRRRYGRQYFRRVRLAALKIVGRGKPQCQNCGCEEWCLLEINHMRGGGKIEYEKRGPRFYLDIVKRRRTIVDLNVLCKLCNILHYLNRRYGKLPYKISFDAKGIL